MKIANEKVGTEISNHKRTKKRGNDDSISIEKMPRSYL